MFKALGLIALLAPFLAAAQTPTERAKEIFADYQARAAAFDPRAADLYCDSATIRNVRTYPDGQQRTLELLAPQYKELVRMAMPLAKARGDTNSYSDITFATEGDGVRVTATRHSDLKNYASPLSLLVGQCSTGDWGVLEELSESRP